MGYTHYWRRPSDLDQELFTLWTADLCLLFAHLPEKTESAGGFYADVPLHLIGTNEEDPPLLSGGVVWFNGGGGPDLSHEDFLIERHYNPEGWERPDQQGRWFACCKTARKPYDLAVTAALIRFKFRFGESVSVFSDGTQHDWKEALDLCTHLFGTATLPWDDGKSASIGRERRKRMKRLEPGRYRTANGQIAIISRQEQARTGHLLWIGSVQHGEVSCWDEEGHALYGGAQWDIHEPEGASIRAVFVATQILHMKCRYLIEVTFTSKEQQEHAIRDGSLLMFLQEAITLEKFVSYHDDLLDQDGDVSLNECSQEQAESIEGDYETYRYSVVYES